MPGALARTARDTARSAREIRRAGPPPRPPRRRWEPPIDVSSWSGALIVMLVIAAALWVVQIVDSSAHLHLDRYGLRARDVTGLRGIVIGPFVHGSYAHLLSNTVPFVALGWVVLLAGVRVWALVSVFVVVVGGALTWLGGPSHEVLVGVSGLVFGWLGYLVARAVFSRRFRWIVVAALVVGFFGTLLGGLLPTLQRSGESWQAHVFGFLAGAGIGWALHPRHPRGAQGRGLRRAPVS